MARARPPIHGKLAWRAIDHLPVGGIRLAVGPGVDVSRKANAGTFQNAGIRPNTFLERMAKELYFRLRSRGGVPPNRGPVHSKIGEYVTRYAAGDHAILDVGAGAMQMEPFVPREATYNALDIAYSEFQLRRIRQRDRYNLALASITQIPLDDDSVDIVIAAEMLHQVPPITEALADLRRVLKPGGLLLCSTTNSHQPKYKKTGPNQNHAHVWGRDDFLRVLLNAGFETLHSEPVGTWDEATGQTRAEPPADADDATSFCYVARSTKA